MVQVERPCHAQVAAAREAELSAQNEVRRWYSFQVRTTGSSVLNALRLSGCPLAPAAVSFDRSATMTKRLWMSDKGAFPHGLCRMLCVQMGNANGAAEPRPLPPDRPIPFKEPFFVAQPDGCAWASVATVHI